MTGAMLVAFALLAIVARVGEAQGRGRGRDRDFSTENPSWWGSVSGGWQLSDRVGDPKTQSLWDFDQSWAMRATLERAFGPQTSLGLVYTYSRMPLRIAATAQGGACEQRCTGDATIATYGITARSGGGLGFHLLYEGFFGAMQFSNFSVTGTDAVEFATLKNTDLAWSIATGVGYGISRDFQLFAAFEYASNIHEKTQDLFIRRTSRHYTPRIGVRVGW